MILLKQRWQYKYCLPDEQVYYKERIMIQNVVQVTKRDVSTEPLDV